MLLLRSIFFLVLAFRTFYGTAQSTASYSFWKDDSLLRKKYFDVSMQKKRELTAASPKQYAKDYKEIYDHQFEEIEDLWTGTRAVTSPEINNYLQSIVKKIIAANPVLYKAAPRVVFTRDHWPNAVSMGDGSIAINGGLLVFLNNEAELAFIICHELAHYYLDHTNKSIKRVVELYNSEDFKKEVKRLSKQEYGAGKAFEELTKKMTFGSRKHSRDNETEADKQAFLFFRNTGYDCNGIISCLQMLDRVDDSSIYKPLIPEAVFNFEAYPFKKRWTQKESVLFAQVTADDASSNKGKDKDSLKTHPDCATRIRMLQDSIVKRSPGKHFLVDEHFFHRIKREFIPEIAEQQFNNENLARNLYYSLLMLQNGAYPSTAVYSVARNLNMLFKKQKEHKLGAIEKEQRSNPGDYNLLLRMIDRLRLDEIAAVNYFFCKKYESQMSGYKGFSEEQRKAQLAFNSYQP